MSVYLLFCVSFKSFCFSMSIFDSLEFFGFFGVFFSIFLVFFLVIVCLILVVVAFPGQCVSCDILHQGSGAPVTLGPCA